MDSFMRNDCCVFGANRKKKHYHKHENSIRVWHLYHNFFLYFSVVFHSTYFERFLTPSLHHMQTLKKVDRTFPLSRAFFFVSSRINCWMKMFVVLPPIFFFFFFWSFHAFHVYSVRLEVKSRCGTTFSYAVCFVVRIFNKFWDLYFCANCAHAHARKLNSANSLTLLFHRIKLKTNKCLF